MLDFVQQLRSGRAPSHYLLGYEALDTELDKPTYELVQLYLAGMPVSAMASERKALEDALQERRQANASVSPQGIRASAPRFTNASGVQADPSSGASGGDDAAHPDPVGTAAAARGTGVGTAAAPDDAMRGIPDEQLGAAADIIGQMVAGTYRGSGSRSRPAPTLTTEPQGALFLLDAVRAAARAGAFSDPALVAGLGRWADALPALIQRVEADGRVPPPAIAALREGADRAATTLRVMVMAPHQGFMRSLLSSALLRTPRSLSRPGAPVDREQIEQLGSALMDRLYYMGGGVPQGFRQAGLETIRDMHGAHLLNTSQQEALERNFNERVDSRARSQPYDEHLHAGHGSRASGSQGAQGSARSTQDAPRSGVRGFFARMFSTSRQAAVPAVLVGRAPAREVIQSLRASHRFDDARLHELKEDLDRYMKGLPGALTAEAFNRKYAGALAVPIESAVHRGDYAMLWRALP